ncbi:DNA polymerase IV [Austwickia sp. TVS 96-490-7B]|nr:DNA polymerase IV [Austwickia sp. TVS 96-490-7B]
MASGPLDDTGCTVLHVDMDAYYASVTLLEHPDLQGIPVIIGGGGRGVVLSATYEAREFGVTSAMPMARARQLCPQAVVIPPDHGRYAEVSRSVMEVFRAITPLVEPLSLDEAFLDVSGAVRRLGSPMTIGQSIRATVHSRVGITCSVGAASTKFVAKIASGLAKPDGMVVVPPLEAVSFVQQLPVGALWGVGDRTEEVLLGMGLHTVADIAHTPVETLQRALGQMGVSLHEFAWARDPRPVTPVRREKSVGADRTFPVDLDDSEEVRRQLLALAERTAARARSHAVMGRTVSLRVRFADFSTVTRSRTLSVPTDVTREVYATVCRLYDELSPSSARIRLLGVRLEGLVAAEGTPVQGLLDEPEHGWRDADRAVDQAVARFGSGVVRPASLMPSAGEETERRRAH